MKLSLVDDINYRLQKYALWKRMVKHRMVYLLVLPTIVFCAIYHYLPMVGLLIAFKDYRIGLGLAGFITSPDVGLDHFRRLFDSFYFYNVLRNTLIISFYKMILVFPAPILFALLLNELKGKYFKRFVQTVTYLPNFLSPVIVTGLVIALLSPTYGLVNAILGLWGYAPSHFLANADYFRSIIISIDIWKETGWGAIIYLAAISSVDPQLYESAKMDGASRFRQMWHITLPGISEIIILLYILSLGNILNVGFEQIFLLYSPPVYSVGDIIDTYVYREGLVNANYGFSTAVGLFKSAIGLILIVVVNSVVKRMGKQGIW